MVTCETATGTDSCPDKIFEECTTVKQLKAYFSLIFSDKLTFHKKALDKLYRNALHCADRFHSNSVEFD